ncbi:MAG: hypothetical protein N5P05_004134 (plasmid) [Chroococcopsis gigantea SAG 12.99]|jgi:hypothetical protein|nr:hypothetical protein [Chroococcopsis gigantea SAG 12.99]
MLKKLIFVTALAVLSSIFKPLISSAGDYNRYCNGRFGFCFDYPKNVKREHPPINGAGITFINNDGLQIEGGGINNVLNYTLDDDKKMTAQNFDRITYEAKGNNWYVLSGYQKENIVYCKTYLGKGSINSLYIKYPKSLKKKYDLLVSRVSLSFKPSNLNESY